jgi:hypothetical protein
LDFRFLKIDMFVSLNLIIDASQTGMEAFVSCIPCSSATSSGTFLIAIYSSHNDLHLPPSGTFPTLRAPGGLPWLSPRTPGHGCHVPVVWLEIFLGDYNIKGSHGECLVPFISLARSS